ncbi:MAG TPA: TolC family protein, partial [Xanthomonadales bacterium]|nr:TolC family protein [Xanthomonadales bacterium]
MRSVVIATGMMLLAAARAGAEEPKAHVITLAQAVERVRSAGFDVRMANADARLAAADAATAGALLRPQISISGNVLDANEPQLGMPVARQAYAAATLSIPLSTSANSLIARAANQTARSAQTAVFATTNDAVFATVQAYRKVQLAAAVVVARQAAVADQAAHLRVTEERIAAGKVARYMALHDRAALASAEQALEDAASERDQASYDLAALLDSGADPVAVEPLVQATLNDT